MRPTASLRVVRSRRAYRPARRLARWALAAGLSVGGAVGGGGGGCAAGEGATAGGGDWALARHGDEIVAAGRLFHTGARVVLWTDPGGYDAYSERAPTGRTTPVGPRYGRRFARGGESAGGAAWNLDDLRRVVDQFVLHYDAAGTARECFRILQRVRGLSVHFLLDLDGTIYQTLDVQERAWHATVSNDRSVGVEIANIGAYPPSTLSEPNSLLNRWYVRTPVGSTIISPPSPTPEPDDVGQCPVGFVMRPSRPGPVIGTIQGQALAMYDLTDAQYDALGKLTAALGVVFPRIRMDYPRDGEGNLITRALSEEELRNFSGVLGHWHVQANKIDPGPALDWERVMGR